MKDFHIILGAPKKEKIQPLLQSEGIVIGVDRGAVFAIEEGIELAVALGDFDSVTDSEKKQIKNHTKHIVDDSTQEKTDVEVALLYVQKNYKPKNIYIYNWYGGRVDHLYNLLLIVLQADFVDIVPKIKFISNSNNISYYLPGGYKIKKNKRMEYLSFILLTEVKQLVLQNVKYPLDKKDFSFPRALISNEFCTQEARFSFDKGIIAVIQSKD